MISDQEFAAAVRDVRRALRDAEEAWMDIKMTRHGIGRGSTLNDVYAAMERAQHAAFDARALVEPYAIRRVK